MKYTLALALSFGLVACNPSTDSHMNHPGDGGNNNNQDPNGCGSPGNCDLSYNSTGCVNLQCQQMTCTGGGDTTLSGKVYAPDGKLPLYNAIVYVPNGPVQPLDDALTCDQCGAITSGSPLVTALTGPDGSFTLHNVPVGNNIPLVIQLGHWRRQITVPTVASCVDTPLAATTTRLPRNKSEGDIPKMAIATGSADPFECLFIKLQIDPAEITPPTGNGRIHLYRSNGAQFDPAVATTPAATTLWDNPTTMAQYQIILNPCEGSPIKKQGNEPQYAVNYADAGGRMFVTHYSYSWLATGYGAAPFPSTGVWSLDNTYDDTKTLTGTVNQSFPKGKDFATWLQNVGASTSNGQLTISQWRYDLNDTTMKSTKWISGPYPLQTSQNITEHMTFNTPVNAPVNDAGVPQQCGRVVYSDFHVSANALDTTKKYFPQRCLNTDLTGQEKALVFMLFDLSSCIQQDTVPPSPPIP